MPRKTGVSRKPSLAVREKGRQAINLRMSGATIKQIANQLGYASESGAYKALMRELKETTQEMGESTEAGRQRELRRLDQMLFPIWNSVRAGDQQAINTALRIQERRASLLGLDAPKQIEAKVRIDVFSWNEAIRDFLTIYRKYHSDSQDAMLVVNEIDRIAQERFSGVSS